MSFQQLNLSPSILKALKSEGYEHPTPIQQAAIPAILKNEDILGCAQTGTGKTAAFALPVLHLLEGSAKQTSQSRKALKALILAPTRELAIQISESFATYGKFTGIKHLAVFGGVSVNAQAAALRGNVEVLIATPGRLIDLMNQRMLSLEQVELLILDEADRMLDMGFINDVKKIISRLPRRKQTLFFSATMPPKIAELANAILKNPVKIEITPESSTAEKVTQKVYAVDKTNKSALLIHILKNDRMNSVLVFTRTKHGADKLVKILQRVNIGALAIHGNKTQNARQKALKEFKDGSLKVLVATDIAARGIDVDELEYVINYELPNQPETYVHRIGRTGRAGKAGTALSFCDSEEAEYLRDINKVTSQDIPFVKDHPYLSVLPVLETRNKNVRASGNKQSFSKSGNRNKQRRYAHA